LLPLIGFSLIFAIILCMHVVKTGQQTYWLWIILAFQPLGGLVYLLAIILPELVSGSTGRWIAKAAKEALDPTRAYRDAKTACEDSPTVGNRMRLAQAATELAVTRRPRRSIARRPKASTPKTPPCSTAAPSPWSSWAATKKL